MRRETRRALTATAIFGVAVMAGAAGARKSGAAAAKARDGVHLHRVAHFNQPTYLAAPRAAKHLAFVDERSERRT